MRGWRAMSVMAEMMTSRQADWMTSGPGVQKDIWILRMTTDKQTKRKQKKKRVVRQQVRNQALNAG